MRLVAHLVRADVRRFRLLLAAWVLMEVLNTVFTAVQPALAADVRTRTALGLLAVVLFLTRWLGLIFIVPLVVQTHPLVGSDAFWMTRPIPPRALLASKVLLLGTTFVLVSALCEVVLMAACRVPIREMLFVALQTLLLQSLWLGIVMSLSAVTRNLARFVLVAGGVLVSLVLLMSIVIAVSMRNLNDGPQLGIVAGRSVSGPAEGVVALLLLIAAAVLPLVVQYKTRLTRASVGAGVAGFAVAILFALTWPSRGEFLPVPAWASQESALRLVAESSTGEFRARDSWPDSNRTEWRIGRARLRLRGVEQGWLPTLRLAGATVELANGATLATAGNGYQQIIPFESVDDFPNRVVMRQVLGVGQVAGQERGPFLPMTAPAIVVSQADFEKYSAASGTYRGRFFVDLDQRRDRGRPPAPGRRRAPRSPAPHRHRRGHSAGSVRFHPGSPVRGLDDVRPGNPYTAVVSIFETAMPARRLREGPTAR